MGRLPYGRASSVVLSAMVSESASVVTSDSFTVYAFLAVFASRSMMYICPSTTATRLVEVSRVSLATTARHPTLAHANNAASPTTVVIYLGLRLDFIGLSEGTRVFAERNDPVAGSAAPNGPILLCPHRFVCPARPPGPFVRSLPTSKKAAVER